MSAGIIVIDSKVIIVGGGPAGAACGWRLNQAGIQTIILDKQSFPRNKLCAGWVTPSVFRNLNASPADYPHGILTFSQLICHFWGRRLNVKTRQYSIRRYEFDHWLLKRSGVPVHQHHVNHIRKDNGRYVIDDAYRSPYLIGAGGTNCPVYRELFKNDHVRDNQTLISAIEEEFKSTYRDANCYLWFFENGLPGYSWYVPKPDGYLNIGIGGKARSFKKKGITIKKYWEDFSQKLIKEKLIAPREFKTRGWSYLLRGNIKNLKKGNAFLIGDAAGLATVDMGEGIGPAIKSGIKAAESIIYNQPYRLSSISRFSFFHILFP